MYICSTKILNNSNMTAIEFNYRLTELRKNLEYFAYSLTSDTEDANDLIQDTYVKALSNRDKFVKGDNLKAWVLTIMKNTFINNYRRAVKANTIIDNTKDLYFLNIPRNSGFADPISEYNTKDIESAIASLEDEYKIPFTMHLKGFKYKEIAQKLDISIGTVKSRIFFTRKKLMAKLQDFA